MGNSDDLATECLYLARTAKWAQKPIDASEIMALAERFTEIAKSELNDDLEIDEALVTRAVRYIAEAHGTPMGDDTDWFRHMLRALLEVARPNTGLDAKGKVFLLDLIEGAVQSLKDN